jgi:hypothetical protein
MGAACAAFFGLRQRPSPAFFILRLRSSACAAALSVAWR